MSSEANKTADSVETPDVWVRKTKGGLYEWAIPTLGALNSYRLAYVREFMEARGLTFKVVPAKVDDSVES